MLSLTLSQVVYAGPPPPMRAWGSFGGVRCAGAGFYLLMALLETILLTILVGF